MSNFNRKPAPWAMTQALVAPKWGYVFRGNKMFVPMWRLGGQPFDYATKTFATYEGTPVVGTHQHGVGFIFTSGEGISVGDVLGGLGAFTVNILVDWNGSAGGATPGIFGRWGAGQTHLLWRVQNSATRVMRSILNTDGTDSDFTAAVGFPSSGLALLTNRWDGAVHTMLINGVQDANTGTAVGAMIAADKFSFSSDGEASQDAWTGTIKPIIYYGIVNDYAWSDAQVAKLARDPFGPFRMRDEAPLFGLSVAFTSANLALHHSGASDIGGAIGAALTDDALHNLWDAVSSADASAGDTEYRCYYVKNTHGSLSTLNVITSILTDPTESNFEHALGAAGKNGTETAVANEDTAPATPTFGTTPLTIGTLAAGDYYPIWLKRIVTAGAGAATPDSGVIRISGDDPN